jgi:anti-anti-sigma factor
MELKIQTALDDETLSVALAGEFDAGSVDEFRAAVQGESVLWRRLLLDMSDLAFMDSTGLGALVRLNQRARELGLELLLVRPSPPVVRLLELTGLEQQFAVSD